MAQCVPIVVCAWKFSRQCDNRILSSRNRLTIHGYGQGSEVLVGRYRKRKCTVKSLGLTTGKMKWYDGVAEILCTGMNALVI